MLTPLLFAVEGNIGFWTEGLFVRPLIALLLVSLCCGAADSLVVGSRMAFFSDALAHCALAGVSIGLIIAFFGWVTEDGILGIMIAFGILVGLAVARVREQPTLNNDIIIGVFFAGAMVLAATVLKINSQMGLPIAPETFLFGDPHGADGSSCLAGTTRAAARAKC